MLGRATHRLQSRPLRPGLGVPRRRVVARATAAPVRPARAPARLRCGWCLPSPVPLAPPRPVAPEEPGEQSPPAPGLATPDCRLRGPTPGPQQVCRRATARAALLRLPQAPELASPLDVWP